MRLMVFAAAAFSLIVLIASSLFAANEFMVVDFREDPLNLKATAHPVKDMNADLCAVIRIESDVVGRVDITEVIVYKTDVISEGIIDHYISFLERYITLTAKGYLPFRYKTPIELVPAKVYRLRIQTKGGPPPEGLGALIIETIPPGAVVIFNDIPVPGVTPLTLNNQRAGANALRIEKAGYKAVEEMATVVKDQTVTRNYTLKRLLAGLRVTSNPGGAKVVLDGDDLGTTPLDRADLSPGEGTLVISLKGYETVTRQVRLTSDQVKIENVDLFAQTGSVSLTSEPAGAEVFMDGLSLGKYAGAPITRDKLTLGRHSARASLEGYEDASADFTVEFNKASTVHLRLTARPGALYITSTPEGADISLDDRPTGKKTGAKIENVSAGEHKLTLSLAGYGDVVKKVTVRPGKTETITETMSAIPKIEPGAGSVIARNEVTKQSGPLTGMEFVLIPGGSFMMGSPDNEEGRYDNEGPQHRVTLKPFYMMTTEVTQKMWVEVMGSNPSYLKGDNLPVEKVSWNDCQEFLKKLNQRDPGKGYRLPTESEWEYACRAGTTTRYYTGNSEQDLARAGWYLGNSDLKTHPVGQKTPNAWGLYDMHGNIWEWCEDRYHDSYNGAPIDGSAWLTPAGSYRVLRGGCWGNVTEFCRSAYRRSNTPDNRNHSSGFRVVR